VVADDFKQSARYQQLMAAQKRAGYTVESLKYKVTKLDEEIRQLRALVPHAHTPIRLLQDQSFTLTFDTYRLPYVYNSVVNYRIVNCVYVNH
jgi:hypothetical protein